MRSLKQVLLEVVLVAVIGTALGLAANSLRASDSINLSRNYFSKGGPAPGPTIASPDAGHSADAAADSTAADKSTDRPQHEYQVITFDEVVRLFEDPATAAGANIFVDARNDASFRNGHIPGALQADHYRIEDYIEPVLQAAESADKIIVYCNGGQCEDSIYMCKDLIDFDVPYEKIYLYEGGWAEWEASGQPIETGEK